MVHWFVFLISILLLPNFVAAESSILSDFFEVVLINTASLLVAAIAGICYLLYRHQVRLLNNKIEKLQKIQSQKESILSNSIEGYCYIDTTDKQLLLSYRFIEMLYLDRENVTLDDIITIFSKNQQEKLRQYISELEVGKASFHQNLPCFIKGNFCYYECRGNAIRSKDGRLQGIILWIQDKTLHQKELEECYETIKQTKETVHYLSAILNKIPLPVWKRDENQYINYYNDAYEQLLEEYPNKAKLPNTERSPASLEISEDGLEHARMIAKDKEAETWEQYIVSKGKRYLYRITEIPIKPGEVHIGFGEQLDEVEKLRQEIEYHKTAQADILESSSNAMAMFGSNKRLKFYNQSFCVLWGLTERWLSSNPEYGDFLEYIRDKRKLPEQADFPKYKQEQLRWFTDLIEPYNDFLHLPDGKVLRVVAIPHAMGGIIFAYEDMTDQLKIERSYNTLIAVQNATLDNLHEGLVVFGQNGKMELYNPKFASMWQLTEEFLGNYPHINEVYEACKPLYQYEGSWEEFKGQSIDHILQRQAGLSRIARTDDLVMDAVCVPLPDGGILITYIDVTAQTLVEHSLRERNDALEEADKLKTEFLANVSYELRSPLTSIVGFSEVLSKEYFGKLNIKQKEYIDGIYGSSQYLMSLINDTLDLASIEAGYMSLDVQEFDIYQSLSSILILIQERVKENKLQFNFICPEDIGVMYGDERRIKQSVFKCLSNAIKFTESGGTVTLTAEVSEHNQDYVIISVEDTGIGIPKEEQKVVFDKFYKTESSKAYNRSGAGLGLSVVKNFVELHGGYIKLESEPGKGTNIHCYLPRNNTSLKQLSKWNYDV